MTHSLADTALALSGGEIKRGFWSSRSRLQSKQPCCLGRAPISSHVLGFLWERRHYVEPLESSNWEHRLQKSLLGSQSKSVPSAAGRDTACDLPSKISNSSYCFSLRKYSTVMEML